jgi:hypothetical protein
LKFRKQTVPLNFAKEGSKKRLDEKISRPYEAMIDISIISVTFDSRWMTEETGDHRWCALVIG